jgi:hypothetical protein
MESQATRICELCGTIYPPDVEWCPRDNEPTVAAMIVRSAPSTGRQSGRLPARLADDFRPNIANFQPNQLPQEDFLDDAQLPQEESTSARIAVPPPSKQRNRYGSVEQPYPRQDSAPVLTALRKMKAGDEDFLETRHARPTLDEFDDPPTYTPPPQEPYHRPQRSPTPPPNQSQRRNTFPEEEPPRASQRMPRVSPSNQMPAEEPSRASGRMQRVPHPDELRAQQQQRPQRAETPHEDPRASQQRMPRVSTPTQMVESPMSSQRMRASAPANEPRPPQRRPQEEVEDATSTAIPVEKPKPTPARKDAATMMAEESPMKGRAIPKSEPAPPKREERRPEPKPEPRPEPAPEPVPVRAEPARPPALAINTVPLAYNEPEAKPSVISKLKDKFEPLLVNLKESTILRFVLVLGILFVVSRGLMALVRMLRT